MDKSLNTAYLRLLYTAIVLSITPLHSTFCSTEPFAKKLSLIRNELLEASKSRARQERLLEATQTELESLEKNIFELKEDIKNGRKEASKLAAALVSVLRQPKLFIITKPEFPISMARSKNLIQFLTKKIVIKTQKLEDKKSKLVRLENLVSTERKKFVITHNELTSLYKKIELLLAGSNFSNNKNILFTNSSTKNNKELALETKTLQDLLKALTKNQKQKRKAMKTLRWVLPEKQHLKDINSLKPDRLETSSSTFPNAVNFSQKNEIPKASSFIKSKLSLKLPVAGKVLEAFGKVDQIGLTNKGITIITRPNAPVFASFDGKVLYASEFRGYGPVLIIDHGDGFSTVMIGIGRIDVRIGQSLLEGEPVGIMNNFITLTSESQPNLYLELRRHGKPVNPLVWLSPKRNAT